jgi:hypothetical protein
MLFAPAVIFFTPGHVHLTPPGASIYHPRRVNLAPPRWSGEARVMGESGGWGREKGGEGGALGPNDSH